METELRTRAERKAGQMLAESAASGERATKDGNVNPGTKVSGDTTPTLAQIGVTRDQSSKWQQVAARDGRIRSRSTKVCGSLARGVGVAEAAPD